MTGNQAFELLKNMTEDERRAVCLVWFDDEQIGNLQGDDYEKKEKFFDSLTNEEKGRLLERPLYAESGDITDVFDKFLDGYAEKFEKAIEDRMAGR